MSVIVREGSLEEVVSVVEQITELPKKSVASLSERLAGKTSLILVAEEAGVLLGFKIGYELDENTFYSWFWWCFIIGEEQGCGASATMFKSSGRKATGLSTTESEIS